MSASRVVSWQLLLGHVPFSQTVSREIATSRFGIPLLEPACFAPFFSY